MNVLYVFYFIDWLHIFFVVFFVALNHGHVVSVVIMYFLSEIFILLSFFLSLCFRLCGFSVWGKERGGAMEKRWSRNQLEVHDIG